MEMILPGTNYSWDLIEGVQENGTLYFFNSKLGAYIEMYQQSIEELQSLDAEDTANAQRAIDSVVEQGADIVETGAKIWVLGRKITRTSARIAALTPLIAADGPLPIGDIIFVGLAVAEIAVLAYDIGTDIYDLVMK